MVKWKGAAERVQEGDTLMPDFWWGHSPGYHWSGEERNPKKITKCTHKNLKYGTFRSYNESLHGLHVSGSKCFTHTTSNLCVQSCFIIIHKRSHLFKKSVNY
jgi:hypothetical protein